MPTTYLLIDIFDSGKRIGPCEKLVFDKIEKFLKYLSGLSSVKEIYRVKASIKQHITDNGSDKLYDREVVVKLENEKRGVLEADIESIKKYPGVKDVDVLRLQPLK